MPLNLARREMPLTKAVARYGDTLNSVPTAVVIPIANVPHIRTRAAPRMIGAPPNCAASAPSLNYA